MENKAGNNIRLGIFIISGLVIVVVSLYLIGQNQHLFGSSFPLKARFSNVDGLMPGNNVRFSGIQCGTVKDITIINDSTIEVSMLINNETSVYINKNATAAIGTEGLMGNKVINILPGRSAATRIESGGMLKAARDNGLDDMLHTLSRTNDNALAISLRLKEVADRIYSSTVLEQLLSDTSIHINLQRSMFNFRNASLKIDNAAESLQQIIEDVKKGKGTAGLLLTDQNAAGNVTQTLNHLQNAASKAESLVRQLDSLTEGISQDVNQGKGAVGLMLKDSTVVKRLNNSLDNIEKGTAAFNEDMEALKHNFLFRGYFKKKEKGKK